MKPSFLLKSLVVFLVVHKFQGCPYIKHVNKSSQDLNVVEGSEFKRQLKTIPLSQCTLRETREKLTSTKDDICFVLSALKPDFESIMANAGLLERSSIFGAALRNVFHDAAEIDITKPEDTMGPDGCLSDNGPDSAGLIEFDSPVYSVIEPLWLKWCDKISRADFWVLFAKLVVQFADPTRQFPTIEFEYGRVDTHDCNAGAGRLPLANFGLAESERVFVHQMGLTIDEAGEWVVWNE
jgi:hypothetical protein